MLLKQAAYDRVMNQQGITDYDPYRDPKFLNELDSPDLLKGVGRAAQLGATVGGVGKTLYNLRKGRIGTLAPIIGGIGLTSMALDDYVQE